MSKWLIVRHAETSWNKAGKIQGHTDIGLSPEGIRQAGLLNHHLSNLTIDAAYSSDLDRTMQTAGILLEGRGISPTPSPDIREFGYGEWEGMTFGEVEQRHPSDFAKMMDHTSSFAPPGGESLGDVATRVGRFVAMTAATHPNDETLLVVGHGGALRLVIAHLLDLPPAASWRFFLASASLTVVDGYPNNAVLYLLNNTSFLDSDR